MEKPNYIPSLTPLRGLAAMLVVIFHYNIFLGALTPEGILLVEKWYLMVDLFFLLSGFIMYHVYGGWFKDSVRKTSFINYMKARFARLYPLHFFLLLYLVVWASILWINIDRSQLPAVIQNILDPKAIPTSLLLVQAWGFHLEAPWNTASWSISVEWFLYLLFPLLVTFMIKYRRTARWVLGSFAISALLFIMFYIQPYFQSLWDVARHIPVEATGSRPENTIDLITGPALLRGLCGFIIGMITYELYQQDWQRQRLQQGLWFVGIWAVLLGLWVKDWLPDVLAVLMFAVLILHTAYTQGGMKKMLNNKVFTYLGDISYSIYMVHIPLILTIFIIGMLGGEPPVSDSGPPPIPNYAMNWLGAIIFLLISIGVASLTYHFIERPMRKWLKRKWVERPASEVPAVNKDHGEPIPN